MGKEFNFKSFVKKTIPPVILVVCLHITLVGLLSYFLLINQAKDALERTANRVQDDLVFREGKWDLSLYNSDSSISDANPLYIITSEGFIIERSQPIAGLLDLSRYSLINQYSEPETVEMVTNESWRVLSAPIHSGDQAVGVVFVSFYKPEAGNLDEIDQQLKEVTSKLQAKITTDGDHVDVTRIDSRELPYNISFQIVNRFNKVLLQSNSSNSITRMPTFIDRSYVDSQLKYSRYKEIEDSATGENFLTITAPLLNEQDLISGIVVTAVPVSSVYNVLSIFTFLSLLISSVTLIIVMPLGFRLIKSIQQSIKEGITQKQTPRVITFIKKDCKLLIDGRAIEIPYSSHQYYFCLALFQKPQKKWEVDELLEVLGEDFGPEKWRKIYDTMVALNRKTMHLIDKLFMVKDKRYFLNAQFAALVKVIT